MIRMGGEVAEGIQVSDFTVDMMPEAIENLEIGFERRGEKPDGFRIGNFWAWHVKEDREASLWEARCELIWRGALIGKEEGDIATVMAPGGERNLEIVDVRYQ